MLLECVALTLAKGRGCGPLGSCYPGHGARLITDLPDRLREGTRDLHAQAERAGLMTQLLAGRVTRPAYLRLLRNLHALYAALEAGLPACDDAGRMPLPALRREAALAADLAVLHGPRWPQELLLHESMVAYAQRLQDLARERPRLLMAHAYLRYLGDLNGGQLLRRQVERALGAPAGLSFYDFGLPDQVLTLRTQVREALARLPVRDEAEATRLVDEARWGFRQHQRLFEGLGAG